ncbi:MAG: glycosyltransferase [Candidatus Accumulibacter sp.]|nr:glycosyltransferase [Candidatus Accumulibacter necessarius]
MKISVITAVYNRAALVAQAVESVQTQTWANVEHVVVDGASTDGTLQVLQSCLDDRAILISESDQGIYDALNKGLARATGDVVGLMHSDDFYADDQVLDSVAQAFADPAVGAVYGDLEYVARDDTRQVIRRWRSGEYHPRKLAWGWMPPHPTLYLRRGVIERWGGFDTRFRIAADYDAILRYFGQGRIHAAYLPRVLVRMRVGGESNRSLAKMWLKSREDYSALKRNGVGGAGALAWKNLSKLGQFF